MISKSRFVVALALTLALGVSGIAFAGDDSSDNDSSIEASIYKKFGKKPKLPEKEFKRVNLDLTTSTDFGTTTPGTQANAEELYVDFSKNIKFKLKKAPTCSADIADTTTAQARAACPEKSLIGTGDATAKVLVGFETHATFSDFIASLFNGPGSKEIRVHLYSPTLGAGQTQVVGADIVNSPLGGAYRKRLAATNLPDVGGDDSGGLTEFHAVITKQDKVLRARCKSKKVKFSSTHVYDDGASQQDFDQHKCKQKDSNNN